MIDLRGTVRADARTDDRGCAEAARFGPPWLRLAMRHVEQIIEQALVEGCFPSWYRSRSLVPTRCERPPAFPRHGHRAVPCSGEAVDPLRLHCFGLYLFRFSTRYRLKAPENRVVAPLVRSRIQSCCSPSNCAHTSSPTFRFKARLPQGVGLRKRSDSYERSAFGEVSAKIVNAR